MGHTTFCSNFAPMLNAMLDYRQALGFSRQTYVAYLTSFDRFAAQHYAGEVLLDKQIVLGWIHEQLEEKRQGVAAKATAIRMFGKYLSAIGQQAYILPEGYISQPQDFAPYVFTDGELARLFRAMDLSSDSVLDSTARTVAPVLFRLIYTCGLRPNEGRLLERANIDFNGGVILVTKTKRKKERLVVMSDDMLRLCKIYDARRATLHVDSEYFFSTQNGEPYSPVSLERLFRKYWALANPAISVCALPNVRIYDLRHRFASARLNRWLDDGCELYAKLPYLQAYMGHAKMSETAYYIHILPENLKKSPGIDWATLESLIPEVNVWQQ
jgi:integrase